MLQVVFLFSRSYNVWFVRIVAWIIIFFKHEFMLLIKSRLDHKLQNLIDVDTLTHLSVNIAQNIVVSNIWFKIVAHRCSAMMTFHIISIWLSCFLNAVLTISLIRLTNDEKFPLRASIKMHLITKSYVTSMKLFRILVQHKSSSIKATTSCFLVDSFLSADYTFMIIHRSHRSLYCLICALKTHFVAQLLSGERTRLESFFFYNALHFAKFMRSDQRMTSSCFRKIMISSRALLIQGSSAGMMTDVERTKNVLLEIRNAYSVAKFHGSLNFSLRRGGIMHSSLSRIRFRCGEALHTDWIVMWENIRGWVFGGVKFWCRIYFCNRVRAYVVSLLG
jgi:hypothetical protein